MNAAKKTAGSASKATGEFIHVPNDSGIANAQEKPPTADTDVTWPVIKSPRFLSDWNDEVVVLDLTHTHGERVNHQEYALSNIPLNLEGATGLYQGMRKLGEFPHLIAAFKIALNVELIRTHDGEPRIAVANLLQHGVSLVIWMLRQGHYRLGQIDRGELESLVTVIIKGGWATVLNHNQLLGKLIQRAYREPDILKSIVGRNNGKNVSVSNVDLVSLIGVPLSSAKVPLWFSAKVAELWGGTHGRVINKKNRSKSPSSPEHTRTPKRGYTESALIAFNALAHPTHTGDHFSFYPCDSIQGKLDVIFGSQARSRNLGLDEATIILAACTDWVLDLSTDVIELASNARDEIIFLGQPGTEEKETSFRNSLTALLEEFREKNKAVVDKYWPADSDPVDILHLFINYVQFSGATLASSLYALRANDAIGHGKSFGLYHGCIMPVAAGSSTKAVDVFLSKSPKDYRSFWASDMLIKIIATLEELRDVTRPLHAESYSDNKPLEERRKQKLFVHAPFKVAKFHTSVRFIHGRVKAAFLTAIGLAPEILDGQRAFRRLHCMLYTYRYDGGRIEALTRRLGHASMSQTHWYVTDDSMTEYNRSAEVLYRRSEASLLKEMAKVQSEQFQQQILSMLKGRSVGGGFTSFIGRVIKKLSRNIEFVKKAPAAKAKYVHEQLADSGYMPVERRHGSCMLGKARTARYGANCRQNGIPRPENASLEKCHGCRNAFGTAHNLSQYERELEELEGKAEDFSLPTPMRLAYETQAKRLADLVARERALSDKNRMFFARLVRGWNDALAVTDSLEEEDDE
jgi:hypothetical protein